MRTIIYLITIIVFVGGVRIYLGLKYPEKANWVVKDLKDVSQKERKIIVFVFWLMLLVSAVDVVYLLFASF